MHRSQLSHFQRAGRLGFREFDRYLFTDIKTWLEDSNLSMWDKAGMSGSLEIRVPFLDLDFCENLFSVPVDLRCRKPGTKRFFRRVCERRLPEDILSLPKHGFQVPISVWMKGPLRSQFKDYTMSLPGDVFSREQIELMWSQFIGNKRDHSLKLWVLACLSAWIQRHNVSWQ